MNDNDYKEALFYAASIFNERLGAEFSEDNLVLCCFQTENQQEVFEQFCKQYFPDRLEDRYTEDGYFDFHASAFVGTGDGADGILLRTDIARHPAELKHILLHELAHIFCTRNEIDGDNFFERYCMDDTISREEDGTINAGYAVWRELIAELIAFELDDNCDVIPIRRKKDLRSVIALRGTSLWKLRHALTAMHQRHETILLVSALSAERTVQSQSCVETAQKKNFMQFVPLYTLSRWRVILNGVSYSTLKAPMKCH